MCIYYLMTNNEIIRILEFAGFILVGVRGSHHKYWHPDGRMTLVPHPKKELGKGLVHIIVHHDAQL